MSSSQKEIIYIDIDDEITSIIDKVRSSKGRIAALVLPKRATVLHSIVNMKLLKRTAEEAKKHVVLITSESALMPIAGAVGMYVAKTPQSKPAVPPPPATSAQVGEEEEAVVDMAKEDAELDATKSVGELAGLPPEDEAIEIDNTASSKKTTESKTSKKVKKNKKLKIPNFDTFRKRLLLGGLVLILLIAGWYMAFKVMPRATVTIKSDMDTVVSTLTASISASAQELDKEALIIPAQIKELKKEGVQKVTATGERDDGTKAKGKVTLRLTNCSEEEVRIPAGTTVSSGGNNYITQKAAVMESAKIGSSCRNGDFPNVSTKTVDVIAAENGDKYNLESGKTFSVSGFSNVNGTNSEISGGTSKIVKVVSQDDVSRALDQLNNSAPRESVAEELVAELEREGLYGLVDTLESAEPQIATEPAVGKEASEVTVTSVVVHKMVGVKIEHLKELIETDVHSKIDTSKQVILDDGLDEAIIRIFDKKSTGEFTLSMQVAATAGPEIDPEEVKTEIAGRKRAESQRLIEQRPGIGEVEVHYSPFWVYSTPSDVGKINVVFEDDNQANAGE